MITKPTSKEINTQEENEPKVENQIAIPKTIAEVKEFIHQHGMIDEPYLVLEEAKKEIGNLKGGQAIDSKSNFYKAFTLFEFDKGMLMAMAIPDRYRTFSIDFSRNLQKEYHCENPSEKATAELVALNFVRILFIQDRMNAFLALGSVTDNTVKYFAVLSKELDRANRHYLNALQTLKMLKQPVFEVNIKTQTAIVGQNQVVQSNSHE